MSPTPSRPRRAMHKARRLALGSPASCPPHPALSGRRHRCRAVRERGFTLLETALATVILGVGVVAIIEAHESFMRSNTWSNHAATATFLGSEIREMTRRYPRHDPVTGLALQDTGGGGLEFLGWGAEQGEIDVTDFDDMDDFDGIRFGADGDLPGPIDAFGQVVPETLADGTVLLDPRGVPVPIRGWSQTVIVEKVSPTNFSVVLPNSHREEPRQNGPWLDVDEYPLRITVVVEYAGPFASEPEEVTRVVWIVP